MNNNEEMNMDEITLTEMLKELFEHQRQMQAFMAQQRDVIREQELVIEENQRQHERVLADIESKLKNIQVQAPKPDLSLIASALNHGLELVSQKIEAGPKPVTRQYRFTFFPEQVRQPEYYKIMVLGFLGFVLLLFSYLLLNKHA